MTVRKLQDAGILRVEDGNHGESRPRQHEFVDHGVAFIRASDIVRPTIDFRHADKINETARARITKGIGAPGDILFSHKGTVGKLAVSGPDAPPFVCSPQTTFWRVCDPERLDPRFLYAFMRSRLFSAQWHIRKGETDMADYVSLTAQRTFLVPLPDIDEQRLIGSVLGPIDDRIASARTYGSDLHDLAERLFRSWFMESDPRLEDPASPLTALEQQAWDLIAISGDSALPAGWHERPLDEVARYKNGVAMQKYPPSEGSSLAVMKIAQLRDGRLDNADRMSADLPEDVLVHNGDVIFSWSGSLMVKLWTGGDAGLNQHLFKVTSDEYPKWFFYFQTRAHLPEFRAIAADKQTTMGHIKRGHLRAASVRVPDEDFMHFADKVFAPIVERVILCDLQAQGLEALRDRVLRALMSGEVRLEGRRLTLEAVS